MAHPLTVHFPVALLFTSGGMFIWLLFKREKHLLFAARLLHQLGALGLLAAIFSGRYAKSQLAGIQAFADLLETHEILGYGVAWVFIMLGIWQWVRPKSWHTESMNAEQLIFVLLYWGGLAAMGYMAYLGGTMVYEFGAGVNT